MNTTLHRVLELVIEPNRFTNYAPYRLQLKRHVQAAHNGKIDMKCLGCVALIKKYRTYRKRE